MKRDLLPAELRLMLPPLGSQRSLAEPMVYAHYHVPDRDWAYYVTEGAPVGTDYEYFGFLLASDHDRDWNWRSLRLSSLEETVRRNERFEPGRLTDVVVLPE